MPIESNAIISETDPIYTAEKNSKQDKSEKGQANGYCGLDGGGKVALGNLPASILKYVGVWDASTNTPTLTSPDLSKFGYVYNVSVAGTQFGISFKLGDWAIYNDSGVIEKSDNSDDVVSVNGRTGAVTGLANLTGGNTFTGSQTFDTNTLFVDSVNHKVGIGTTSPAYRLDIKGAGTNNEVLARFYGDTNTIGSFVIKSKTTGIPGMAIGTYGNKERFALLTANVERINIDGDGNVGIGTTNPARKLSVNGILGVQYSDALELMYINPTSVGLDLAIKDAVGATDFRIDSRTGQKVAWYNAGNFGIGTTSPVAKLQVVGLKEYADNAAAIAAGLTAGAFYRTGDLLKVVH